MAENTKTAFDGLDRARWFWAIFFALTVFVYLFGLNIPLVGPDEPRYAQVAREMFERGDWITPTLGGHNWFEKPALLYWLEIAAYHIFGVNEFAARLGPALFGLGTIACLWLIGRYALSEKRAANWLAMIGATTLGILVFSRGASFDIMVTFPIAASLTGYLIHEANEHRPLSALFAFYFFTGVALLAKGLIGAIFPFGIVAIYHLVAWRRPSLRSLLSLLWGIPVVAAVAATWYLPMYLRHGNTFIDEFIIQQHFQRFTSNKYQHPQPFYFFLWVLPLMTIPWLPFFLRSILTSIMSVATARDSRKHAFDQNLCTFARAWLLFPLIFFSFSGSKLPGYILPVVPAAVILAGDQILRFVSTKQMREKWVKALALCTYFLTVSAILFVVPGFARKETDKWLFQTANSRGYERLYVAGLFTVSHNAEFYAAGRLIRDGDGKQHKFYGVHEVREYIDGHGGEPLLVLVPLEYVRILSSSDAVWASVLDENGELAIAYVEAN
jgi:4-amino-4-deoxy-L-arabinose transferase-like glycosyltransferase